MYQCNVITGEVTFLVMLYEGKSRVPHDLFVMDKSVLSHCTECLFLFPL